MGFVRSAMGQDDVSAEQFSEVWEECEADLLFLPSQRAYGQGSLASGDDLVASQRAVVEGVRRAAEAEAKRCIKSEQKNRVLTQGYQVRRGVQTGFRAGGGAGKVQGWRVAGWADIAGVRWDVTGRRRLPSLAHGRP